MVVTQLRVLWASSQTHARRPRGGQRKKLTFTSPKRCINSSRASPSSRWHPLWSSEHLTQALRMSSTRGSVLTRGRRTGLRAIVL
jgi:hypothetical protein